jgi:hypothetical protein
MLLAALAAWLAWETYQQGPERAFGGLIEMVSLPQYGEADAPTRSGSLADRILQQEDGQAPPPDAE